MRSQNSRRQQTHRAHQTQQYAAVERVGNSQEEQGERKRGNHGRELVNGQRAYAEDSTRLQPAGYEESHHNQRQQDSQQQEEQVTQVPQVVALPEHGQKRGNEHQERGAENSKIPDGERADDGVILTRVMFGSVALGSVALNCRVLRAGSSGHTRGRIPSSVSTRSGDRSSRGVRSRRV